MKPKYYVSKDHESGNIVVKTDEAVFLQWFETIPDAQEWANLLNAFDELIETGQAFNATLGYRIKSYKPYSNFSNALAAAKLLSTPKEVVIREHG